MKIEHGKIYCVLNWSEQNNKFELMLTNLEHCDNCKRPATINRFFAHGDDLNKELLECANYLFKKYGEIDQLFSDDNGDCYCEKCYDKNANNGGGK